MVQLRCWSSAILILRPCLVGRLSTRKCVLVVTRMCLFAAVFALTMQAEAETLHPAFFSTSLFSQKVAQKCIQHHNLIIVLRGWTLLTECDPDKMGF